MTMCHCSLKCREEINQKNLFQRGKYSPRVFFFFLLFLCPCACAGGRIYIWRTGVKSASFWQKQRDVKSTAQVATCPICSIFWKPLYQSGKWSSRRNKPYLYSNLLRRNPHCQAHKTFIELGKARSYRKLVRRYCDAIKQGTDQKTPKVWKPRWPSRGNRDCCVSPVVALTWWSNMSGL